MLYVVRHGETDYNVARRICGHAEAQLTEKGYQQAELVAEKIAKQGIQIDRLLASPLKRAQETARKIAERNQLTIETEPRLIEMNFGIYDGEPIETTAFQENRSEISLPFPEGESVLDVAGRIYPLIEEALASEETYLFVCYNAVMRVIDNYFNGKKIQDFLDFHCENTQLVQYGE
ncbi:histidine phosphatase family protein [Enterococcus faecalis]|nr:histidine phosphatase family protein [Enterococcus faecalis]